MNVSLDLEKNPQPF